MGILTWLAIISLTLLPFFTASKDGGYQLQSPAHDPTIWLRPIGHQIIEEMGCSDTLTTESDFVGEVKEHIPAEFHPIY